MPATGTRIFSDPTEFQAGIPGATINLVFTGPGKFSAHLTSASLPRLKLFTAEESLPRIAYISLPPERVNFAVPLSEPPQHWGNVEMRSLDLMFHSAGERMHHRTNGASRWGLISVDPEFFTDTSKALTGSEIISPPVGRVLRPSRSDAVELRRLHAMACRLAETKPKTLAHREVTRAIEHDILYALVRCLMTNAIHSDTTARRRCATTMNRLEQVLAANVNRQLTIPELCKAIGVAERSLRISCYTVLGVSPNQYLRLRRLNLLHIALLHADPATAKISVIAGGYGFSEFGRLAGSYRTIFGESPSATLRHPRRKTEQNLQFAGNA